MRIDPFVLPNNKPDLQFTIDRVYLAPKFSADLKMMFPRKFIRYRDLTGSFQPLFNIKSFPAKVTWPKRSQRLVREDIDPENLQIFRGVIWQRHQAPHKWGRRQDSSCLCYSWEHRLGKMPCRRCDFQLRSTCHNVNRGRKRPIRTLIGDLSR